MRPAASRSVWTTPGTDAATTPFGNESGTGPPAARTVHPCAISRRPTVEPSGPVTLTPPPGLAGGPRGRLGPWLEARGIAATPREHTLSPLRSDRSTAVLGRGGVTRDRAAAVHLPEQQTQADHVGQPQRHPTQQQGA